MISKTNFGQSVRWPGFTPGRRLLGPLAALLLAPLGVQGAQNTTTVTATAQILDFGTFAVLPSCANCTITMGTNGLRTATGGVILASTNVGKPGTFNVSCNNGSCAWSGTVSGSPTIAAGGVSMTVGTFTTLKAGASTPSVLTVGAKLTIPNSGSVAGTYSSGNFTVTTTSP